MSKTKNRGYATVIALVTIAIIVSVCAYVFGKSVGNQVEKGGAAFTDTNVTNYNSLSLSQGLNVAATSTQNGYSQRVVSGACNTASSTGFVIGNPFGATTTATVLSITGTGNATSSTLVIGTTTQPVAGQSVTLAQVSPSLVNTVIGTSTDLNNSASGYYIGSGITVGPNVVTGATSTAGTNTSRSVIIGPTENLASFSTSTLPSASSIKYVPNTICTSYNILFQN